MIVKAIIEIEKLTMQKISNKLKAGHRLENTVKQFGQYCIGNNNKVAQTEYCYQYIFQTAENFDEWYTYEQQKNHTDIYTFFELTYVEEPLREELSSGGEEFALDNLKIVNLVRKLDTGSYVLLFDINYTGTNQWLNGDYFDEVEVDLVLLGYYNNFEFIKLS